MKPKEVIPERMFCLLKVIEPRLKGKSKLMKMFFLLQEEKNVWEVPPYKFIEHMYGPYSNEINDDLWSLKNLGIINITKSVYKRRDETGQERLHEEIRYEITRKGRRVLKGAELDDDLIWAIEQTKAKWKDRSRREILNYVFDNYMED